MYLSYVNFIVNKPPQKVRNPPAMLDLSAAYKSLAANEFPLAVGNLTVRSAELCSSSQGCAPRRQDMTRSDYTLAMKDGQLDVKSAAANNSSKAVLLNIRCTYALGNERINVLFRVPRSGVVGIRVGLSVQSSMKVGNANANASLAALGDALAQAAVRIIAGLAVNSPPTIASLKVSGLNIITGTANRPERRLKHLIAFARLLAQKLPDHNLDYTAQEGRHVVRANFKPKIPGQDVTIGLTQWGMVDFIGSASLARVQRLSTFLVTESRALLKNVEFNNSAKVVPKAKGKKVQSSLSSTCRKNTPPAQSDGTCADQDRVPVPNDKGSLCCKKYAGAAKASIVAAYARANMDIPQNVQAKLGKTRSAVASGVMPVYNRNQNTVTRNGKPFRCMAMSKPDIQQIAKSLGIFPKGTKQYLCDSIESKLKNIAT